MSFGNTCVSRGWWFHKPRRCSRICANCRSLLRVPAKAALHTALRIGLTYQLAIYDSAYVALAKRSQFPLITLDQPQQRAAVAEGVTLKALTDFAL
jgi:predicted nucleic acid-binding protein